MLIERDNKVIAKCTRAPYLPVVAKQAEGVYVTDEKGIQYMDFISSACVMNTGYNHKEVVESVKNQIDKYIHFSNDYFYTEPQVLLAEKLVDIVPGKKEKKVIFGFSGSDAIDTSIKLSRAYTKKSKIISFIGAYHGSTYGAISVSAIDTNMKRKIGPLLPEIFHLKYPIEEGDLEADRQIDEFLENFRYYIPLDEVAAVIIEPIAGDLGIKMASKKFMKFLEKFCKENNILLVVDEIQQGFGRTGKWFSIDYFNVEPDILVMGKAMGSGFPISAAVASKEIIDSIAMPGQLFTLEGNAVCTTAALATVNIIEKENLLSNAVNMGEYITKRFDIIKNRTGLIKEIRSYGLSIGVQLNKGYEENEENIVKKICYECYKRGLLLIYLNNNTLRVQPPLIINQDEAEKGMDIIESVFEDYFSKKISDEALEKVKGW